MSFFNYNLNIPAANNNPSDDQPLMQTNFNSISDWTLVDHRGFEDADNLGGYHTNVHQVPLGNYDVLADGFPPPAPPKPVNISGIGQLFTLNVIPDTQPPTVVSDTQLFSLTGNNGLSQLTGDAAATEGYQWVGGVLIQWGKVSAILNNNTTNSVVFKGRTTLTIPFPNNLFVVIPQIFYISPTSPDSTGVISIDSNAATFTKTGFTWYFRGSSSTTYRGFYWVAIGN